jgi:hypothetical protein
MAMACLRLFTVPPLPPLPDLSVPRFSLRMALATDLPAALPYFLPPDFLREPFFAAIIVLLAQLVEAFQKKGCSTVLHHWLQCGIQALFFVECDFTWRS